MGKYFLGEYAVSSVNCMEQLFLKKMCGDGADLLIPKVVDNFLVSGSTPLPNTLWKFSVTKAIWVESVMVTISH